MTNKKIIVLAILIVGLFALSTVSAADNLTDDVVGTYLEINEVASSNSLETEDVIGNADNLTDGQDVLTVSGDDEFSIVDENVLSESSPSYSKYSLSVYDTTITSGSSGTVTVYITPYSSSGYYAYDFYFRVYDSGNNLKINENLFSTTKSTSYHYTISANTLDVGTYTIKLVNYADSHLMSSATLTVTPVSKTLYDYSFNGLNNIISNTPSGGIINLNGDILYDSDASGITISKALTIDGKGHTIDANDYCRIFLIQTNNVVLKNIVFKNAYQANAYGSAIFCSGNYCKVINCTFMDSYGSKGAAVYLTGSSGEIS